MPEYPNEPIDLVARVEHVTFYDESSGFTIAQAQTGAGDATVTIVGDLMSPAPGTVLKITGHWTQHPRFGRQFRVTRAHAQPPTTLEGIEKYLGSGLIKGVGREMAARIVRHFGEGALEVIDTAPQDLLAVEGIGPKRVAMIHQAWKTHKAIRDVMLFLQSHGVSTAYAYKIFRRYGQKTIDIVQQDPYRLASDIFGIGFIKADAVALKLGFAADSAQRLKAGVLYTLGQLAEEGHLFYPRGELIDKARSILKTDRPAISAAIGDLAAENRIVIENPDGGMDSAEPGDQAVFLPRFHHYEVYIAQKFRQLLCAPAAGPEMTTEQAVEWIQNRLNIQLAAGQQRAVITALTSKILVITGGPGTGKTTIVHAITRIYERTRAAVLLAAPTGRAAKRLAEATGRPAKTIHRLLKFQPHQGGFAHNANNPLDVDLLVLDEASMIDVELMAHLLEALPLAAVLILVGDVNQLPSVGPGNLLKDILASGTVPQITLKQIFRQARESRIVINAHRINRGHQPQTTASGSQSISDFYFIQQQEPKKILATILTLVSERIPARFGFDPLDDIQVLTPMHRGIVGSQNLNRTLQAALNPQDAVITRAEQRYGRNDKVMQIRNNYDKNVFNGDIGRIVHIDAPGKTVLIQFDGRPVTYEFDEMNELVLAYAVSVHKSQGSEYPAVVIPITIQHYMLLQRNLIYTAVTRAKQLVVLVGTKQALAIAIRNDTPLKRYTRLADRLGRQQGA